MEAEVLNPHTMADVNGNNNIKTTKISNAELEVLKLQELVRKLEKQNEQLRSRANAVNNHSSCSSSSTSCSSSSSSGGPRLLHAAVSCLHAGSSAPCPGEHCTEPFAYFQPSCGSPDPAAGEDDASVLDEVEVLDLDSVLDPVLDPESWLYVSPRARLQGPSALSPLQWCRRVLDRPGPEVELAKMTLCHRLDQAKRWRGGVSSVRPYSCIETLSSLSCPVLPYSKPAAPPETPAPSVLTPLRASCSLSDRAPTFLSNSTLHNVARRHAAVSPQSSVDSEAGVSELDDDSISMSYKLQDMTDVEVMARLQEESLRQDYASTSHTAAAAATAAAARRSSSFSLHSLRRSELDLEEEEEEEEEDEGYDQLPPPQPRLFRTGSVQRGSLTHSHTFSSIRDCRRSAVTSPFSLGGFSQYSGSSLGPSVGPSVGPSSLSTDTHSLYRNSTDKLRRSMPNLLRAPSMPSVPSTPCLASPVTPPSHGPSSLPTMRSSQSFDSSSVLSRLHSSIPSPGLLTQRVQSVGNFPSAARPPVKATAYVSPTVQQGPPPSALPSSVSLHSIPALATPLKPTPLKAGGGGGGGQSARSSLPRPASFVGSSGLPRPSKIGQTSRSLLTPPKSLAALSALKDASWKDGCY